MPCPHDPCCPAADAVDRDAAHIISSFPEQGWSRLCNGVIVFEDTGELLPDGSAIAPHRGPAPHTPPVPAAPSPGMAPIAPAVTAPLP